MDWDDVRHFLALARTGSVRAAGSSIGVSHSTVARRVEGLEARLRARLFDRNRDGYVLTRAGQRMLPAAERVERELATLERGLAGGDARMTGVVSLTCCDAFVSSMLMPALARLCGEHPGLEVALSTDARPFDLSKREADIALRVLGVGASPPEHLIGRKLAPLMLCSYVATAHAARLSPPAAGARWLAFDDAKVSQFMIETSSHPELGAWGRFSSIASIVQAARAGLGLLMLPTYIGDPEPSLQRLAHPDLRHVADLWLLSHPDLRDNARIRAARSAAIAAIEAERSRFEGTWSSDAPQGPEVAPSPVAPEPLG